MGVTERILDGLGATIRLNERVADMAERVEAVAREVRGLDRRLIRVETALELVRAGRLCLPPEPSGEDR